MSKWKKTAGLLIAVLALIPAAFAEEKRRPHR